MEFYHDEDWYNEDERAPQELADAFGCDPEDMYDWYEDCIIEGDCWD